MILTELNINNLKYAIHEKCVCIVEEDSPFDLFLDSIKEMLGISFKHLSGEYDNGLRLIKSNNEFLINLTSKIETGGQGQYVSFKREKKIIGDKEHIARLYGFDDDFFMPEALKGLTVFENVFFDLYRDNNYSLADRFFCEIKEGILLANWIEKIKIDDSLRAKILDFAICFAEKAKNLNAVADKEEKGLFYFEDERLSSDFINIYTFILYRSMLEGALGIVGEETFPIFLDLKGIRFSKGETDLLFDEIKKLNGQVFLILDNENKYISDKCDKTLNI